jgi:hypothetical protein
MTGKEFMQHLAGDGDDVVAVVLALLEKTGSSYCVIGGLGVNAYADPVVSLDLDLVVVAWGLADVRREAELAGMKVEAFEHGLTLSRAGSDLRIQLQKDARYQAFLPRASVREVLGHSMKVASLEDVLQGKIWAYTDVTRRQSKRQKDLADILRLVETYPELKDALPDDLVDVLE